MLEIDSTVLMIVDVQGKLAQAMFDRERLFDGLVRLARGARALGLPVLLTEQNPARMGGTIPELGEALGAITPLAKMSFGCGADPGCAQALAAARRRQVLLAGIEAHVCMYQTAAQLAAGGYEVHAVADAISSRTEANYRIGLERMRAAGAAITSVESALFELMRTAEHPAFRAVLGIVK